MIKEGAIFKGGINDNRYFEIVKVLKNSVKVRELNTEIVEELGDDSLIHWVHKPIRGDYKGKEIRRKIINLSDGVKMIKIDDLSYFLIKG